MTDIVERLNIAADVADDVAPQVSPTASLLRDAIAEIMRLRTTIEQMQAVAGLTTVDGQTFAEIKQGLRK